MGSASSPRTTDVREEGIIEEVESAFAQLHYADFWSDSNPRVGGHTRLWQECTEDYCVKRKKIVADLHDMKDRL